MCVFLSDSVPALAQQFLYYFYLLLLFCFRQTAFQKFQNLTHICECVCVMASTKGRKLMLDKNSRDNVISFFFYSYLFIIVITLRMCVCVRVYFVFFLENHNDTDTSIIYEYRQCCYDLQFQLFDMSFLLECSSFQNKEEKNLYTEKNSSLMFQCNTFKIYEWMNEWTNIAPMNQW